jgi:hypothetical protein
MRWIAVLAAVGVLFAALPLEAATSQREISPVYAGTKSAKPAKPRSNAQKSAQKKATKASAGKTKKSGQTKKQKAAQQKATKAAAAEMKRKGPTQKQRESQKKATKAAAAKAKAKPNKRHA